MYFICNFVKQKHVSSSVKLKEKMMNNLSNRELIALAQEGDERATKLLFQKVRGIMIMALTKSFHNVNRETIEDIVQDSLVKVFRNLHNYKPTFTVGAWVGIIARISMIDHLRKGTLKEVSLDYNTLNNDSDDEIPGVAAIIPSESLQPDELMENEDRERFANMLLNSNRIAEPIRIIAKLRFVDEYSYQEIAQEVDSPLGTVKAQIHRFKSIVEEIVSQKQKESVY